MKAIGVGQCALDLIAVVDPYPGANEKIDVLNWDRQGGGPTANALATLAKFGVASAFVGIVGDDPEGHDILAFFGKAGVDVSGVKISGEASSQLSFIAVEKSTGKRTIFCRRASGKHLQPDDVPQSVFSGASILLLDGALEEVSIACAKRARASGIPVLLDAGRVRSRTRELMQHCDFVAGSELFASQLGWSGDPSAFRKIAMGLNIPVLTLTLGEKGSVTFTRNGVGDAFATPAFPVQAVDTTGAGDIFHGAYAYGILQSWPIQQVLRFASAAAALKCTRLGGSAAIPDLPSVLSLAGIQS
ncbi:MAG: hypothetical protein A2X94_11310 [Bdellovibrionales bacterium GWB1_55_8]|nr:MAG: hypothetical protein A2X94_11310 [Bdellovibrionales bacterium GWB1_55_8]